MKIENNTIIEAPKTIKRNGFLVFGYNKSEQMMFEDGYGKYDFPLSMAQIKNNKIIKKEIIKPQRYIFTKLQIRRACRKLGIEQKLDTLICSSDAIKKDWADAQEINLNDEIFIEAIKENLFTENEIKSIKEILK